MIATLFWNSFSISWFTVLWLLLPMCLSVAIVYKTIRIDSLRRLPKSVAVLMLYMVGGLAVLGAALWLLMVVFL